MRGLLKAGIVLAAMGASAGALASDLPSKKTQPPAPAPALSDWKFQATLYGWLTGINGDVGARYLQPIGIDVTPIQVLNHLKGVFMGAVEAKNDTWAVLLDVVWSKLGAKRTGRFGGQLDFSQTLTMGEGYIGYRIPVGGPNFDLRGLIGVRGQSLTTSIQHFGVLPRLDRSARATIEFADPLVGVSMRYDFDKHWYVQGLADVGGFNVGSRLTAQGFGAVGYKWTENISTSLGYRALYTDYQKSGTVYKTTMHGVFLGLGIGF